MFDEELKNVEAEGNTVEEAIEKALKALGASRDNVTVKVLSEEQKGLFGMEASKPAKVKVYIKEKRKKS